MYLSKQYSQNVTPAVHLIWGLMTASGIFSAYYHATLSTAGQLWSEISVVWILAIGSAIWFPPNVLPKNLRSNRQPLVCLFVSLAMIGTLLAFVLPVINSLILITLSIPVFIILLIEMKSCVHLRVKALAKQIVVLWIIGIVCWINDKALCDFWTSSFNFQYFHAIFHILIFNVGYKAIIIYAYFHSMQTALEKQPDLVFWPWNSIEFGVPYIIFKAPLLPNYTVKKSEIYNYDN